MKCQSKCSPNCKNIITKDQIKYIWLKGKCLEVCYDCYYKIKLKNQTTGKPVGRPSKRMQSFIETQKKANKQPLPPKLEDLYNGNK